MKVFVVRVAVLVSIMLAFHANLVQAERVAMAQIAALFDQILSLGLTNEEGTCFEKTLGVSLLELLMATCFLDACAIQIPPENAAQLKELRMAEKDYILCNEMTFRQGDVVEGGGPPLGFQTLGGSGLDFEIFILNPNARISCQGCILEMAESSVNATRPANINIPSSLPNFPAGQIDGSNMVLDGITFTSSEDAYKRTSASISIANQVSNVQIKNCIFKNVTTNVGILLEYVESLDLDQNMPWQTADIENCVFQNGIYGSSAIAAVPVCGLCEAGNNDMPPVDRAADAILVSVTGCSFTSNEYAAREDLLGIPSFIQSWAFPVLNITNNYFCDNFSNTSGAVLIASNNTKDVISDNEYCTSAPTMAPVPAMTTKPTASPTKEPTKPTASSTMEPTKEPATPQPATAEPDPSGADITDKGTIAITAVSTVMGLWFILVN